MAAAFGRARAALDRTPPLSSTVEGVLQRCGSRVDLLLETAINYTMPPEREKLFISQGVMGRQCGANIALPGRPLLTALQQGAARCTHCSPLGRLQ